MQEKENETRTQTHQRARRTGTQPEPHAQRAWHAKEQILTRHVTTPDSHCLAEDPTLEHTGQREDLTEHGQSKSGYMFGDLHGATTIDTKEKERERRAAEQKA